MKKLLLSLLILFFGNAYCEITSNPLLWQNYIKKNSDKIYENWYPLIQNTDSVTTVEYAINKNGELLNTRIIKSSGDYNTDKSALDAIRNSTPFEPLPKEYKGEYVTIEFEFKYKIINNPQEKKDKSDLDSFKSELPKTHENAFNTKIPELKNYLDYIYQKISSNWFPSKTNESITITLTVRKDGTIMGCKILNKNQTTEANSAIQDAVIKSLPFEPLPKEYEGEYLSFKLTFDKNIQKQTKPTEFIDDMDILFYFNNRKDKKDYLKNFRRED